MTIYRCHGRCLGVFRCNWDTIAVDRRYRRCRIGHGRYWWPHICWANASAVENLYVLFTWLWCARIEAVAFILLVVDVDRCLFRCGLSAFLLWVDWLFFQNLLIIDTYSRCRLLKLWYRTFKFLLWFCLYRRLYWLDFVLGFGSPLILIHLSVCLLLKIHIFCQIMLVFDGSFFSFKNRSVGWTKWIFKLWFISECVIATYIVVIEGEDGIVIIGKSAFHDALIERQFHLSVSPQLVASVLRLFLVAHFRHVTAHIWNLRFRLTVNWWHCASLFYIFGRVWCLVFWIVNSFVRTGALFLLHYLTSLFDSII